MSQRKKQPTRAKGRAAGPRTQQRQAPRARQRGMRATSVPVTYGTKYTAPLLKQSTVLEHKEYIADLPINADGTFSGTVYKVNPGNASLHPWLAQQAQGWEEFEYLSLKLQVRSTCPTATSGLTLLGAQYDSYDAPFGSKVEMQDYGGNVSQNVWVPVTEFSFDCKTMHDRQKNCYVLPFGTSPSGDERLYYPANAVFATSNGDSNAPSTVGECFVSYRVRLIKPKINPSFSGAQAQKEAESLQAYTPASGGPISGGQGGVVLDTGTPLDYSSSVTADSLVSVADQIGQLRGAMPYWLVSALAGGQYTSTGPTATTNLQVTFGTGVDNRNVSYDPAIQKDATNMIFDFLSQYVIDTRNIADVAGEKIIDFKFPTMGSTGNIAANSGFARILASSISKAAYDSILSMAEGKQESMHPVQAQHVRQLGRKLKCSVAQLKLPTTRKAIGRLSAACPRRDVARGLESGADEKSSLEANSAPTAEIRMTPSAKLMSGACSDPRCSHRDDGCPAVRSHVVRTR